MIIHRATSARRNRYRGAVLVETAFCIPILVVMLTGAIQYAMILHAMITCDQYAREGGRYTMEYFAGPSFNNTSTTASGFAGFMNGVASSSNIPYSKITATVYIPTVTAGGAYSATGPALTAISNSTCTGSGCTSIEPNEYFCVEVSYNLAQQYLFYGLVPGLPAPGSSAATYTAKTWMVTENE